MAEQAKKHELSGEYYNHKRSSLLASAIFLALSLPNIDLTNFSFVGIKLTDRGHVLVPMLAGLIAAYYLLHYFFIWRTEAVRYARSEAAETNPAYQALSAATVRLDEMVVAAKQELDRIAPALAEASAMTDADAHFQLMTVAEEIDFTDTIRDVAKRCANQALGSYLLLADGTGQPRLRPDLRNATLVNLEAEPVRTVRDELAAQLTEPVTSCRRTMVNRALVALKARRPDLFLLVGPAAYAAEVVRQRLPDAIDRLDQSRRDLNKARRMFQVDQRALWFRTSLLDLWVPIGLFTVAGALFVWTHR